MDAEVVVDAGGTDTPKPAVDPGPTEIVFTPPVVEPEQKPEKVDAAAATDPPKAEDVEVDETPRDDKGRFKRTAQDRIDELTRERRDAERNAEYWKARAMPEAQPKPEVAPDPKDFPNVEDYINAKVKHDVKLAMADVKTQTAQENATNEVAKSWAAKMEAARTSIPDFEKTMEKADAPVAGHVAELLFDHDQGPQLVHHFALHPDVLEKINKMTPTKAAFAIGALAKEVVSVPSGGSKVVEAKISNAPPPTKSIGQGRSTTPALDSLSMDDYVAARKAQGAWWAR